MASLEGFIDGVITEMREVTGIKYVPDDPSPDPVNWPFSPVSAVSGRAFQSPFGLVRYLHDVQIGLLAPHNDANEEEANQIILPKLETIIEKLYTEHNAGTFTDISTFADIDYTYGVIEWAGINFFGLILTIRDVKIQNTI